MKTIFLTLYIAFTFGMFSALAAGTPPAPERESWVVYYTDKLPAEDFMAYDLIVFDSDHHPPLLPLQMTGKTLLGYISFGEAEEYRSYFETIKQRDLLLGRSDLWKDHLYIDTRKPQWRDMVLDELIPMILNKGFDGIMIDTIDSAIYPETLDVETYKGMKQSAIDLIKAVRARYPHIKIMLNRGLEILPDVASDIDMLMAESIYTDWTPNPEKPVLVKPETYDYYLKWIEKGRAVSPKLKIYSMDYWDMSDAKGVAHIYATQRAKGFIPYVSTMDLQNLHREAK